MNFPLAADTNLDDLPRTLRREHEARAREARERQGLAAGLHAGLAAPEPAPVSARDEYYAEAPVGAQAVPAAVKRIDIPFFSLMGFFIKAAFAAIPALILLGAMLWIIGQGLERAFPELIKMKILISFPN